jgi:hypothetical protein
MQEYIVVQDGPTDFTVCRHVGDIWYTIASCRSRDYAEQIVEALNPVPEQRLGWDDLESIAQNRGR